ncbi:MAG: iron-sulfur cluster assembly scaffold protein, partial [Pseudomonadota bacterium]
MSYNLEQLYTPAILSRAANLSDCPTNETLPYRATVFSPLCGSDLTMALDLDDMGHVIGYGHAIRACAFGQASL